MQPRRYPRQMNTASPFNNFNQFHGHSFSQPGSAWNTQQQIPTPYEVFAKPELPLQTLINQQGHSQWNTTSSAQQGQQSSFGEGEKPFQFDKVMNTVGQLANTYHQVSPIIKEFGTFINAFR